MPSPDQLQDFAALAPDLAIEVVSPSDLMRDVDKKVEQSLSLGVPTVWVFIPRRLTVRFYHVGRATGVLREAGAIVG